MIDVGRMKLLAGLTEAHSLIKPLPAAQHVIDKYVAKITSMLDLGDKTTEPAIRDVLTAFASDLEIFSK